LRRIKAGEELNYDYGLIIDEPYTRKLLAQYPCWCGSENCRGTLLAPKDDEPRKKARKKKKKDKAKAADKKKRNKKKSGRKSEA
jgi:hypothetical protein